MPTNIERPPASPIQNQSGEQRSQNSRAEDRRGSTLDELRARSQIIADQPYILSCLDESLRRQRYAGSTDISQFVFLALQTRFFENPVSLAIKGTSSSGKSYALRRALDFVPNDGVEVLHGLSEMALTYSNLDLRHRYLVIQEAAGMSEGRGRALLRQLLSEGRARYLTVQQTGNGLESLEPPAIEGPTGLIMTTTAHALHPEDETRILSVHMDESPQRLQEILRQRARATSEPYTPDYDPWHALHNLIGISDLRVKIPYLSDLVEQLPTIASKFERKECGRMFDSYFG